MVKIAAIIVAFAASAMAQYYGGELPKSVTSSAAPVVTATAGKDYGAGASTASVAPVVTSTATVPAKGYPVEDKDDDKKDYGVPKVVTTSKAAPVTTVPAVKDYNVAPPPSLKSTAAPVVKSTPAYTPECEGEPTSSAGPVKPTPTATATPKAYVPATTKAPVLTNIVQSGASPIKASAFVAAAAGVAALFL